MAIVGLGFGKEFIPIYQNHPDTNMYAICQRSTDKLNEIGDQYKVSKRYSSFEALIQDPDVDAVHIKLSESSLDGVAPFEAFLPLVRVMGRLGLEPVELRLRAIDDGDRIVAGAHQQFGDHGTDLSGADDDDVFHIHLPRSGCILVRSPCER